MHVRHILFAATPGVDIHALAVRAERALLELCGKEVPPDRFAQLAAELSNCPSSVQGGDLGWITPEDCAPELANELFFQKHAGWGITTSAPSICCWASSERAKALPAGCSPNWG